MIAWINFASLLIAACALLYFYVRSVQPAALERKVGEGAYARCTRYRMAAMAFEAVAIVNYVVYRFYPLPLPLPVVFPWDYWVSVLIALAIAVPGGYLMWRGMRDAGEESLVVKKEHTLYGGIYHRMRHPQATGEVTLWWVAAFMLNSPFLALFSLIWLPIFYVMCRAEERDLALRYGEAYRSYQREVGFLLPRRSRARGQSDG
ncbi:MAG: methyltransferase [Chloroflexota bacterium]|nr:methyltransferase [Chloroflexota bacterium]